jgi:hypothetical protein
MSNPKNDINLLRAKIKRLEALLNKNNTPSEETLNNVSGTLKNLKDSLDSLDIPTRFGNLDFDLTGLKGFRTNAGLDLSGLKEFKTNTLPDISDLKAFKTTTVPDLTDLKSFKTSANTDLTDLKGFKTSANTDLVDLKGFKTSANTDLVDLKAFKTTTVPDLTDLKSFKTSANTDLTKIKTGDLTDATGLKSILDGKATVAAVNLKANSVDVYSKTDADGRYPTAVAASGTFRTAAQVSDAVTLHPSVTEKAKAVDVYTKTAADGKFSTPASVATAIGSFDFSAAGNSSLNTRFGLHYTRTQTDSALGLKANTSAVYTKSDVDSALGLKANSSTVYTKTETDTALGLKANSANVYNKTETDTALGLKANSANVYNKTEADTTFRTSAQVNSAIGAFDFSSAGNSSFNNRLLGTENKVGSIGLVANAGSANTGFGGFFAVAGSQGWNYIGSNGRYTIALSSASLAANAGTDIPEFSLALERNAYYLNGFLQGRTETDVQKFITYDMNVGDSRGDLTLNAGSVFIKGDDIYGAHLTHFTHNRGAIVGGTDNGGAIYFGVSAGDQNNGTLPTAGIETSWNNASSPRIGIGVTRDGNKASIMMDYAGNITFKTNNTTKLSIATSVVVNNNIDFVPNLSNTSRCGTAGQAWKELHSVTGLNVSSDERVKYEIKPSNLGLDFIKSIEPVSYKLKSRDKKIIKDEFGNDVLEDIPGVRPHYGFIAQQIKSVLGDKDFAGYTHDTESDLRGLRYEEFISPMVKAIQELSKENDYLKKKLEEKDKQIQDILLRLSLLESK